MKRHSQILAGTALGLLMASAPLAALPLPDRAAVKPAGAMSLDAQNSLAPLILAQTECQEGETPEQCAARQAQPTEEPAAEEPAAEEPAAEEPAAEQPPAEEPAAAPAAEEPAAAPAEEPAAEQPAAEEPAAEEPAVEEPAAAPAADDPASEAPAAEEPAAEEEEPAAEEPAADEPAAVEEPAAAPAAEEPSTAPAAEEPAAEQQVTEEPAAAPAAEEPASAPAAEEPSTAPAAEEPAAEEPTADEPAAAPAAEEPAAEKPAAEDLAPLTDSGKEEGAAGQDDGQAEQPAATAAPQPESDAAAQTETVTQEEIDQEIEEITSDEGEQIELGETREERQAARAERRERRENARVIEEFEDNRVIIEINNNVFIESPDYERIILEDDEVFYYALSDERVREVIVRPDGVRVITIRNRYGDVIRRVRVLPDGREIVLVWVPEQYYDEVIAFRDPGEGLPPLVLDIPREEYILEAELVEEPEAYYTFLEQPPVEEVERIYSIEEVKYSARIRDKMRRIDLDTINFEFGSAEIEESELDELEAVAEAILRILEENPAETFLIEGHTDAVGTDLANLALSDRRAEAVATALSGMFGIPPENLVTQGYGEQYLKVEVEEAERENRRVAIRRITPLVTPVASAQ